MVAADTTGMIQDRHHQITNHTRKSELTSRVLHRPAGSRTRLSRNRAESSAGITCMATAP